jgi:hypothetical protein
MAVSLVLYKSTGMRFRLAMFQGGAQPVSRRDAGLVQQAIYNTPQRHARGDQTAQIALHLRNAGSSGVNPGGRTADAGSGLASRSV